jgi:hypothetical protein
MSAVQLAMYKAKGDMFNGLIRWWTGSQYSHCELVVRGVCYSSTIRDGGVRAKVMALPSDRWDVIDLPWADVDRVTDWFIQHERDRYGWLDLITSQLFGMQRDGRGEFCSEACAKALGLRGATRLSPQGLLDACIDINKHCLSANHEGLT